MTATYQGEALFVDGDGDKTRSSFDFISASDSTAKSDSLTVANAIAALSNLQLTEVHVILKSVVSSAGAPAVGSDPLKSAHTRMNTSMRGSDGEKLRLSIPGPIAAIVNGGNLFLANTNAAWTGFLTAVGAMISDEDGGAVGTTAVAKGKLHITGKRRQ